jgi:hypothetical protein
LGLDQSAFDGRQSKQLNPCPPSEFELHQPSLQTPKPQSSWSHRTLEWVGPVHAGCQ